MAIKDLDDTVPASQVLTVDHIKEEQEETDRKMESMFDKLSTPSIVSVIKEKLDQSERARREQETQWLKNTNSFRGEDSHDSQMRKSEVSDVFVRTTAVKTKAAFAQITEALFSDNKFPISIQPTVVPEGVSEWAHIKTEMDESAVMDEAPATEPTGPEGGIGFAGDGFDIKPGSTATNMSFLGGLEEEFEGKDGESVMAEGYSHAPGAINVSPAKMAARKMEKQILDDLAESKAHTEVRRVVHEMCLLGTGIMKGPFNVNKEIPRWVANEEGERVYDPIIRKSFRSSHVSVWNTYPDPSANKPEDMQWLIERHRMNTNQLAELTDRPHFNSKAIDRLLEEGGNYVYKDFEASLEPDHQQPESLSDVYEVLEYWGYLDKKMLREYNLPTEGLTGNRAQVNVWISGTEVLRVVVNPFLPQRIPYYVVPYEVNPWSLWGTGVPESMEDSQKLMNGFMRMAVDNLALAGNLVFDVDESMLEPGQNMEIYPGKIFRHRSGGQGQSINALTFPNVAPSNMDMFRQIRQIADEETGIPSFAHGQTGITSPTRTASGMSMLLQNASLNIKTVIRNIDDYLLAPLGQAYFATRMQFGGNNFNIEGDLEVKATGSSSLQAKETRSTQLNTFLQLSAQPALAPMIKIPTLLKELALTLSMDPEEIINSPEEAAIYAKLMGDMAQAAMPPQAPGAEGLAPPPGGAVPGGPGFTGNTQGAGNVGGINGTEGGL